MLQYQAISARMVARALALAIFLFANWGRAETRFEGSWPDDANERVTLAIADAERADAVRKLAEKAGWGVVIGGSLPGTVDVQVNDQPAKRVLELILGDGSYVARRDGSLIAVVVKATHSSSDSTPPPPSELAPSPQPSTSAPSTKERRHRGKDRVVLGERAVVERDEVVGDLVLFGGSADVFGTVSGDIAVFGGSVEVHDGAHVLGDVATFGGSVDLKPGALVDGDTSSLGGSVHRDGKATVSGSHKALDSDEGQDRERAPSTFSKFLSGAGSAITRAALLFAFGAVLLALATGRLESLQIEVASRPMRSFALGILGIFASIAAVVALCVTLIGIPVALVATVAAVLGGYAGVCAVLTATGAMLVHHKTSNPYLHLALGCALYLVLSSIPFFGGFVTIAVVLIGFGALIGTRFAGFVKGERHAART